MYKHDFKDDYDGSGTSVAAAAHEDTINATFRLNARVMKKLREESEKKQISLNAYINQVLYQHVDWDLFESKIGMMPFPKQVLSMIFADLDEEEITKLAIGVGKNSAIEMSIFVQGRFNVETFVSWIETRMKNSGCEVAHRVREQDGMQNIIIKHDLGKNWSLYLKILVESTLKEAFGITTPDIFASDSLVSITCKI